MSQCLVSFWGTRGSIATPGRSTEKYGGNTACVSVKLGRYIYILDTGTGLRALGDEIIEEVQSGELEKDLKIFLSHTHLDHIQGIPFFVPAYNDSFKVNFYGHSLTGTLSETLHRQMERDYFPIPMSSLQSDLKIHDIEVGESLSFDEQVQVTFFEMDHPGSSYAIKLTMNGKSMVYATDNELNLAFEDDATPKTERGVAYLEYIKDVDFLIADGQYTVEEYKGKEGWGHTTADLALRVAKKAGVKKVSIFHHDPMHTDSFLDDMSLDLIEAYNDSAMEVFWAREGLSISF